MRSLSDHWFEGVSAEDRRVWLLVVGMVLLGIAFFILSQSVLGVRYNYTLRVVAIGGLALGVVSGVLGCFAVLRRESLMGDALSHAALPGVGIAFLLFGRDLGALLIGAGIASWLGVQFIRSVLHTTRIKQDTAMGIVLAAWFAAGIALLAYIQARPDASQAGLDSFIFGQAAAMVESDVRLILSVGLGTFLLLGIFWKELKLVTFDIDFASANGFRVNFLHTLLSTLIVVAIVLGLQLAGVVLMVGMLIAPAIAARQWTHKLHQMLFLAAIFGAFAGGVGAVISAVDADVPTGPLMIVVAFITVVISISFAPERGLLWVSLRQRRDRRRFASRIALRDMYRYASAHGGAAHPVPTAFLAGIGGSQVMLGLRQLGDDDFVRRDGAYWVLTAKGIELAVQDAENQQLWDVYREYGDTLGLPILMEDRQRDIHELLPAPAIDSLMKQLKANAS